MSESSPTLKLHSGLSGAASTSVCSRQVDTRSMEAALLTAFINNLVARLFSLAEVKYKVYKGFKGDVTFLMRELPMITSAIEGQVSGQKNHVLRLSVEELQQIAHQMEDCIDQITYCACWKQRRQWYHNYGESFKKKKSRIQLAQEMKRLRRELEEAHNRKERYYVPCPSPPKLSQSSSDRYVHQDDLVGLKMPLEELLKQLAESKPGQLKVIVIVGFRGLGKTVLAHELYYDRRTEEQFNLRTWLSAVDNHPNDLLAEMLKKLQMPPQIPSNGSQLSRDLRKHLNNKRCFIVVDDVQSTGQWNSIMSVFPRDISNTIVVTTKFDNVAQFCSSPNGFVFNMGRLDGNHSKKLLLQEARQAQYLDSAMSDSKELFDICDGQPLALSAVGKFMRQRSLMEGPNWEAVCNQVRSNLETDDSFDRLHQVLIHEYTSLPCQAMKACLLYFAMFPSGHRVRTRKIMRQWLAEGFVEPATLKSDPADINFKNLLDRNIIHPIDVSNNKMVKTCRTYGMMQEYIVLKSVAEKFIALSDNGNIQPNHARRLSLQCNSIAGGNNLNIDLSLVKTLIIFGQAGSMLNFDKYQLLRVLDLEECTDLQNHHVKKICNLLLLKYLSLGIGVTSLPEEIGNLKLLETLDLKSSAVNILPTKVFQLPHLTHLFGKFELPDKVVVSEQCTLQTLEGFLVNKREGYEKFMSHMKKLQKVKIWCQSSATSTSLISLQKAVQEFIRDEMDASKDPRFLSIHFDTFSEDWLKGLEGQCYLKSLKLKGKLQELPGFVSKLRCLRELCIRSAKLSAGLLTALGNLKYLEYLKLTADELDDFVLQDNALPELLRLCFVLKTPTLPKIEYGALPKLKSLQLLCKGLNDLSGIQIDNFKHLREVVIDVGVEVTSDTIQVWIDAAENHPNKPKVVLINTPNPTEGGTSQFAASDATENGIETQILPSGLNSTLTGSSVATTITVDS